MLKHLHVHMLGVVTYVILAADVTILDHETRSVILVGPRLHQSHGSTSARSRLAALKLRWSTSNAKREGVHC